MQKINMDNIRLAMDTLTDKQMLQVAKAIILIKSKETEEQNLNRIY